MVSPLLDFMHKTFFSKERKFETHICFFWLYGLWLSFFGLSFLQLRVSILARIEKYYYWDVS